jgi:hypothetical protein
MKSYLLVKFAYPVYFLLILAVHFLGEGLDYLFHSAGPENGRPELVRKSSQEMEAPPARMYASDQAAGRAESATTPDKAVAGPVRWNKSTGINEVPFMRSFSIPGTRPQPGL